MRTFCGYPKRRKVIQSASHQVACVEGVMWNATCGGCNWATSLSRVVGTASAGLHPCDVFKHLAKSRDWSGDTCNLHAIDIVWKYHKVQLPNETTTTYGNHTCNCVWHRHACKSCIWHGCISRSPCVSKNLRENDTLASDTNSWQASFKSQC